MVRSAMDSRLKQCATNLRKKMTDEERKLWYLFLHRYPVRFRRQYLINGFIADFYCNAAKLVIELDGSQHYSDFGKAHDQWRSQCIEQSGIQVLRFSNGDIHERFQGVCMMIDRVGKERLAVLCNGY